LNGIGGKSEHKTESQSQTREGRKEGERRGKSAAISGWIKQEQQAKPVKEVSRLAVLLEGGKRGTSDNLDPGDLRSRERDSLRKYMYREASRNAESHAACVPSTRNSRPSGS